MPRCHECSKVVIPRRGSRDRSQERLRTWPSGPELIRSADRGCDLCSFVRKEIEKVSAANLARIGGQSPIVLRNFNHEISLGDIYIWLCRPGYSLYCPLSVGSRSSYVYVDTALREALYDPVVRAHELLEACMLGDEHDHDLCKPSEVDPSMKVSSLPRRLLDLSHGDIVLTLDTQEWTARNRATADELSNYCTLSYRWGQKAPACMLRTRPVADRIMFFVSLPQTFQDAITVARGLEIRFLWIDALCIIQPSAHGDYTDWNMEGPRMWLVYQNAICNIAATCSEQPSDGFLHKVGTDYNPPCSVSAEGDQPGTREPLFMFTGIDLWYASVVASNLNRRGWVAQERLLSRRILYFTEEGVFWECQAGELDIDEDKRFAQGSKLGQNIGPLNASLMIFADWLIFIELYSMSKFTLPTDRLIALSSIARCVPFERFGHEYYAGIWGSHLLRSLSWRSETSCSATERESCLDIAPSWSWASVPGGVVYPTRTLGPHSKSLLEVVDVQKSLAEDSNQYGNMNKGALKLRALLCNISLPTNGKYDSETNKPGFPKVPDVFGKLAWDEYQDTSTEIEVYTVIPLGVYCNFSLIDALVITLLPSTGDGNTYASYGVYRRIGHIYWELSGLSRYGEDYSGDVLSELPAWMDTLFPDATEQTIVIL